MSQPWERHLPRLRANTQEIIGVCISLERGTLKYRDCGKLGGVLQSGSVQHLHTLKGCLHDLHSRFWHNLMKKYKRVPNFTRESHTDCLSQQRYDARIEN